MRNDSFSDNKQQQFQGSVPKISFACFPDARLRSLALLYLVYEDVHGSLAPLQPGPDVPVKRIWLAERGVLLLVEFDLDDIRPLDSAGQQMPLEQVEQQIALASAPDAGDDLHKAVALGVNKSIQIEVALDDHKFLRPRIISKITPPQHGIHSFFTVHAPKVRISATASVHVGLRLFRFAQSHLQPSPSSRISNS